MVQQSDWWDGASIEEGVETLTDDEDSSYVGSEVTLDDHSRHVEKRACDYATRLGFSNDLIDDLGPAAWLLAAGWIERDEQIRRMIETHGRSGRRSPSFGRLQRDLDRAIEERRRRGVFAICTSEIRRTAQGFGSFGPSRVQS